MSERSAGLGLAIGLGTGAASIIAGAACLCAGHPLSAPDNYGPPPDGGLIAAGALLILIPVLIAFTACIAAIAREGTRQHRAWLAQFPPEQQAAIIRAEKAAAWAATAAAAVAMHRRHRKTQARLADQVISGFPDRDRPPYPEAED